MSSALGFVHIMEISWTRINDQGEFILGISQDVRFVAPDVLPSSLGVGLGLSNRRLGQRPFQV